MLLVVERLGCVENDQDKRSIRECFAAARDAELLDFFKSFPEAGGIDKFKRNAFDCDPFGDEIARGAGRCSDNGAIALDEAIEEGALAGIGTANDRQCKAVVDHAAARLGSLERGE